MSLGEEPQYDEARVPLMQEGCRYNGLPRRLSKAREGRGRCKEGSRNRGANTFDSALLQTRPYREPTEGGEREYEKERGEKEEKKKR